MVIKLNKYLILNYINKWKQNNYKNVINLKKCVISFGHVDQCHN